MCPRKYEPREMKLVSEYLAEKYPNDRTLTRVRLGAIHPSLLSEKYTDEEKAMLTVWRRWADAIVIRKEEVILIEAAILPSPGDISILLTYSYLFRYTPEFSDVRNLPVKMELVSAIEDPVVTNLARSVGIRTVIYAPEWIYEYLGTLSGRKRRPTLTSPVPGE